MECKVSSLSKKSSYVLDAGKALYQWNGAGSARVTRAKAIDLANKIRMKERGGLSQVFVLGLFLLLLFNFIFFIIFCCFYRFNNYFIVIINY